MIRQASNSVGTAAAFMFLVTCVPGLTAGDHPNVVVLLSDDLGWKDIGCYGGPVKTPALDGLAAEGVRFTDFHSGAAVCSPSRATTLTGRQHLRCGIYSWIHDHEQNSHLLEREVTLAEVLKNHGYETVHLGKWHLGMPTPKKPNKPTPTEHGFDYWFGMANGAHPSHKDPVNFLRNGKPVGKIEGYSCRIVVDEAISWLDEERDPDKPFFLNVWFHEPHAPLAAPDEIVSRYGDVNDPAAIYSGTIDNTDRALARLLEKLQQVDAPDKTLIIYSSDNGSYRADRVGHLRGTKGSNFEGGIRVPGIFHWPGTITKGLVEDEPAGLVDLLPTVCGLLRIDKPEGVHLDGSDLSPLLRGRADEFTRHQPLFWLLPASGPCIVLRDGNYSLVGHRTYEFPRDRETMAALKQQIEATLRKQGTFEAEIRGSTLDRQMFEGFKDKEADQLRGEFIKLNMFNETWIPAIRSGTYGKFELYDLKTDPSQKTDMSSQLPEVAARLKKQLLEINASVMADAPDWNLTAQASGAPSDAQETLRIEGKTGVHRLSTSRRSPFDAFVYVNRIPENAEEEESPESVAGRIFGRLANQEGRILLKLPQGMNRDAYLGFKTFLRYEGAEKVGNCAACHTFPEFTDLKRHVVTRAGSAKPTPSLRNLKTSQTDLRKAILRKVHISRQKQSGTAKDVDDAYAAMNLSADDVPEIVAFLGVLGDVSDAEFRELILNVKLLDTSKDIE